MKLRPTIFLSGVSSEFGSFRDAVEVEVQKKGCFAENQSSFGVDYHTVEEMLRRRINDADAVIHIVGFRFGAEPKDRPADKPRRSYTQMELDIARELEKPVYVFLSSDATIADALDTDDAETSALQLAHRHMIEDTNSLFYFFNDKAELCKLAGEIEAVTQADFRVDISRIDRYAPAELIGREQELGILNDSWLKVRRAESSRPHVLTFVALGGEGKTSLVAKWLADLAYQNWPGCDSAFAWSFYSQGTREQYAVSSDLFLKEAINFFGNDIDKEFAASAAGAYEKGQRLARIVGQRRSLLILDGLEPLQYAPTSPTPGELKDPGVTALLKGLAANSDGLCVVTTRYSLPNLKAFWQTTAHEALLTRLSQSAGVHLLKTLGVNGSAKQFGTLVEDVKGHALTLNLIGTYLRDAYGGDIRRRDLIKLDEADTAEQGGHAFRVLEAYKIEFVKEGGNGTCALAILLLLGLFDRPLTLDCLVALLQEPVIPNLTEPLIVLSETQRNVVLKRLEDATLLTINREASGTLVSLDAHPLLREYFARQLRLEQPETWRTAHKRVFEHLCGSTSDKSEPTLEDLQPLYQAVAHGCHAGLHDECVQVFWIRILRRNEHYTWHKLGAYSSELAAHVNFFEVPWTQLPSSLSESYKAWVLNEAAFCLRAIGRLTEALEPMRAAVKFSVKEENWEEAAGSSLNLSELELAYGDIARAIVDAEHSLMYADRETQQPLQIITRAAAANAVHQGGRWHDADRRFKEAEQKQAQFQPKYPLLYSHQGFKYCDLLLSTSERAAWQRILQLKDYSSHSSGDTLRAINHRTEQIIEWTNAQKWLLDQALDQLTLNRTALYRALLSSARLLGAAEGLLSKNRVDVTISDLRRFGTMDHLALGLLTRAWFRFITGARIGLVSAQEDLDEAWEIAERGPMRLLMADIHLHRARLFFREEDYPWESAEADLKAARTLIEQCGYWRRKEELEDAERVILNPSNPR